MNEKRYVVVKYGDSADGRVHWGYSKSLLETYCESKSTGKPYAEYHVREVYDGEDLTGVPQAIVVTSRQ